MRLKLDHRIAESFWLLLLVYICWNLISLQPDGLYLRLVSVWSDWSLHIGMAHLFESRPMSQWFSYHPIFADGKLTYPFAVNALSAGLMKLGFSLHLAFFLPSVALFALLILGIRRLTEVIWNSKGLGVLAVTLLFLSSGLEFIPFLLDFIKNPSWSSLSYPEFGMDYLKAHDWLEVNVLIGHLVPQRAFLFGMTLSVWVMASFLREMKKESPSLKALCMQGAGAGLLPIIHMHSFMVMVLVAGSVCLARVRDLKKWWSFPVAAGAVSIPLYLFFIHGEIDNAEFMQWKTGVYAESLGDALRFWLHNWGAQWVLGGLALGLFWRELDRTTRAFFLGFGAVFLGLNFLQTQPIRWDNSKPAIWVFLALCLLSAKALQALWRKSPPHRALASVLLLLAVASGLFSMIRLLNFDRHTHLSLSSDDIRIAEEIKENTHNQARFATAPTHNHPVTMWAARPLLLGYTGWAWNFGFNYWPVEEDLRKIFQGGETARELIRRHRISYVFIGPTERAQMQANESWYAANYPLKFQQGQNRVYAVSSGLNDEGPTD